MDTTQSITYKNVIEIPALNKKYIEMHLPSFSLCAIVTGDTDDVHESLRRHAVFIIALDIRIVVVDTCSCTVIFGRKKQSRWEMGLQMYTTVDELVKTDTE
jgi:hypothetical protein